MKHLKTPQELNETSENLNISDVSESEKSIKHIVKKTHYWLFKKTNNDSKYYYVRTMTEGLDRVVWFMGYENNFGLVSSVGGELSVEACTPMEKEVANQLKILSDWYRVQWEKCSSDTNPVACREAVTQAYNNQKQTLLDLLAAMRNKTESQQRKLYNDVLKNSKLIFLQ